MNFRKSSKQPLTPPRPSEYQSINVYCPNMAFIQLTTRRRRSPVTLDQLRAILQSTIFTTGYLSGQVLFTMINRDLLGYVQHCPIWPPSSPLRLLCTSLPDSLLSTSVGPFLSSVILLKPPHYLWLVFHQLFTLFSHIFFLLLLLFLSHRCLLLSHLGLQLTF